MTRAPTCGRARGVCAQEGDAGHLLLLLALLRALPLTPELLAACRVARVVRGLLVGSAHPDARVLTAAQ